MTTVHEHSRRAPVSRKNPAGTTTNRLKRTPDHEEVILEYKGLLKSNSEYKKAGLKKYQEAYVELKK